MKSIIFHVLTYFSAFLFNMISASFQPREDVARGGGWVGGLCGAVCRPCRVILRYSLDHCGAKLLVFTLSHSHGMSQAGKQLRPMDIQRKGWLWGVPMVPPTAVDNASVCHICDGEMGFQILVEPKRKLNAWFFFSLMQSHKWALASAMGNYGADCNMVLQTTVGWCTTVKRQDKDVYKIVFFSLFFSLSCHLSCDTGTSI